MSDNRSSLLLPPSGLVIVSGGQTGVDRAALDAAEALQIPCTGWCPAGRRAEDGVIPEHYELRETTGSSYTVRTEWNIRDTDGTLVLAFGRLTGGTGLTAKLAREQNRPLHIVTLQETSTSPPVAENSLAPLVQSVVDWVTDHKIRVLNVAGPRASQAAHVDSLSRVFCDAVFRDIQQSAHLT